MVGDAAADWRSGVGDLMPQCPQCSGDGLTCDRCGGFVPQNIHPHRYRVPWWMPYLPQSEFGAIAPLHRREVPDADIDEAWEGTVDVDLELVYEVGDGRTADEAFERDLKQRLGPADPRDTDLPGPRDWDAYGNSPRTQTP